jgi:hypothetical protein
MKNNKAFFLIIMAIAFFFINNSANAQTPISTNSIIQTPTKSELILGVPKVTDKNLFLILNAVEQIPGLQYKSYCSAQKLILITYDSSVFNRKTEIIEAITNKGVQMPMFVKEGSFADVNNLCQ